MLTARLGMRREVALYCKLNAPLMSRRPTLELKPGTAVPSDVHCNFQLVSISPAYISGLKYEPPGQKYLLNSLTHNYYRAILCVEFAFAA